MILQVTCPSCRGPLTAPADMAGSTVRCPRCNCQMLLPKAPPTGGPPPPPPETPITAPTRYSAQDLLPPGAAPAATTAASATASGTAKMRPRGSAKSAAATTAAGPIPATLPPGAVVTPATAPPPGTSVPAPAEPVARFIAKREVAIETPGALPTLHLTEQAEKPSMLPANSAAFRGPLLAVVLVMSMVSSAAMLLWEPGATQSIAPGKHYAWRELEQHYFGDGVALQPYQRLLRQAQQAHHKGDRAREAALLRRVLDMLHAERPNPAFGLTGYQTPALPNDRHLEETITRLLREN